MDPWPPEKLTVALSELEELDAEFMTLGKQMLAEETYVTDIFMAALLNRGLQLLHGFMLLVRNEHFVSAAPFVRLQIDNCCRHFAGTLVVSADELTMQLMEGQRLDKLVDRDGKKMTDAYLLERLAEVAQEPWLRPAYEKASGFVHFSGAHIFATTQANSEDRTIALRIYRKETNVPEAFWVELVEAFGAATELLLRLTAGWVAQKEEERGEQRRDA